MNNNDELNSFQKLLKYRSSCKRIQQISFNLKQIEYKYPLESIQPSQYESMQLFYANLLLDLESIIKDFKETK